MDRFDRILHRIGVIFFSAMLAACGGGGGSDSGTEGTGGNSDPGGGQSQPSPTPTPEPKPEPKPEPTPSMTSIEGVYDGQVRNSQVSSNFNLLILENNEFWALYGYETASEFLVTGFVQGQGKLSNGTFTSTNGKDYFAGLGYNGMITARFNDKTKAIDGTMSSSGGVEVGFSGAPIIDPQYDYLKPASIASVAGAWTTHNLSTAETIRIDIANGGGITATTSNGCRFTGSLAPRFTGKNVFDVTIRFGSSPCLLPNQRATGFAIVYPLVNGRTQLVAAVTDSTRSFGDALFGTRQ